MSDISQVDLDCHTTTTTKLVTTIDISTRVCLISLTIPIVNIRFRIMTEDEGKSPVLLTAEGASPCLDTAYLLSTIRLLVV